MLTSYMCYKGSRFIVLICAIFRFINILSLCSYRNNMFCRKPSFIDSSNLLFWLSRNIFMECKFFIMHSLCKSYLKYSE